jgi:hypothetical protein
MVKVDLMVAEVAASAYNWKCVSHLLCAAVNAQTADHSRSARKQQQKQQQQQQPQQAVSAVEAAHAATDA